MKVVFIAEQFVPPVFNGSTLVYDLWLRMLHRYEDAYAIFFTGEGEPTAETHAELRRLCRDYLVLPGHARSLLIKSGRALARYINGSLFAPAQVEEFSRGPVHREISRFLARHKPDVLVLSKLNSLNLVGERIVREFPGPCILDLHDDFVSREDLERTRLAALLEQHPALADYPAYRMTRMRQKMSRFDLARARRQERRLLGLFDRILISSDEEFQAYAADPQIGGACVHAPWPLDGGGLPHRRVAEPEFDAGFIASDAPFNLEALLFFTREILPLVRQHRPDFRLLVTGGVTIPFSRLGMADDGIVLERSVKEVATFYERIAIGVVPLLTGTGISLKTLEALRFGRPVVAMPAGARGLKRQDYPQLHLTENAQGFARCVIHLLEKGNSPAPAFNRRNDPVEGYYKLFLRSCEELGLAPTDTTFRASSKVAQ
jgi:glycosyltransferase involved in cell wall biosynthesis